MKKTVVKMVPVALALTLASPAFAVEGKDADRNGAKAKVEGKENADKARARATGHSVEANQVIHDLGTTEVVRIPPTEVEPLKAALSKNPVLMEGAHVLIENAKTRGSKVGALSNNDAGIKTVAGMKNDQTKKAEQAYAQLVFGAALDLQGEAQAELVSVLKIANEYAGTMSPAQALEKAVDKARLPKDKGGLGLEKLSIDEILRLCLKQRA